MCPCCKMDADRFLLRRKTTLPPTKGGPVDQKRIMELTQLLFDHKHDGTLQAAFDNYVGECMIHFRKMEIVTENIVAPTIFDAPLLPTKSINAFVKRKK